MEIKPEDLLLGITVYAGMVFAAFWLAMVIWAYRDMRSRSRDFMAQIIVAIMVALLNLPGLLIYLLLRPRETLSEAYERSLEEEALLQEIEEKPTCPGCGQRVHDNWQACPGCHTRLKRPCLNCGKMLELAWNLCPYCAMSQVTYTGEEAQPTGRGHVRPATVPEQWTPRRNAPARPARTPESLEFVEGDEY